MLLVLFVAFVGYIAVREHRRETATFRNLEIVEELTEDDEDDEDDRSSDPAQAQSKAISTMSLFNAQGRFSGWLNVGVAVLALGGIIIGAATVSEGTEEILDRYGIEGTVFGATIVTAVLTIEDLFLTVRPIRKGVPEIGIGNVIGSLVFSVTGKLGIVVLAGGTIAIDVQRPALAPPGARRHDRGRRLLPVHRATQALARLRAARALCRLLDRQLRRLRRRSRRRLTTAARAASRQRPS